MFGKAEIRIDDAIYTRNADDTEGIYDLLVDYLGHEAAEDASCWCELAGIGDEYEFDVPNIELRIIE